MDRILFTALEVARILSSDWIGTPGGEVENFQIDSRKCGRGTLFVPLKGERTDGHLYLEDIAGKDTLLSLVDEIWFSENRSLVEKLVEQKGMAFLPVADTLASMQQLAVFHINRFSDLKVVGVTGSNGKTTTKEILGAILSESAETVVNEGNLNSDIGLPLSVFRVEEKHEIAVFEMGMNRVGEMDLLASIVRPDFAVITNIGTAHIGLLGSQDAIADAKKQIFSCFDGSQKAIIPADDQYSAFLSKDVKGQVVLYGVNHTSEVVVTSDFSIEGFDLKIAGYSCHFSLPGEYNLKNVYAAVATALAMGVEPELIARGISKIQPIFGRGELFKGKKTLLRDCYNANPDSMEQAIKLLQYWEGRSIAVLGDMLELGDCSSKEHSCMGIIAAQSSASALFLFGPEMEQAFESVKDSNYEGYSFWTADYGELEEAVKDYLEDDDLVLLKGSRGLALERLSHLVLDQ